MTQEQINFLDALTEKAQARMVQMTFRRVGDADLAIDIVQETLLTACIKVTEVSSHENPVGWLFKTLDYTTKREMHRAYHTAEVPLVGDVPAENNTADLPMEDCLPAGLTDQERTLLIWRIKEERSYEEIAELRGITPVACRKQMSRAMEKCRRLMREDLTENFFR